MRVERTLFAFSSAVLIAVAFAGSANAATQSSLNRCMRTGMTEAECACQFALDSGSKSELRIFLRNYRGEDTACNTMASTVRVRGGGNDAGFKPTPKDNYNDDDHCDWGGYETRKSASRRK